MDQRRHVLFLVVSLGFMFVWMQVAPVLFPDFFPKPKPKPGDQPAANALAQQQDKEAAQVPGEAPQTPEENEEESQARELAAFPEDSIILGDGGFESGYLLRARVNTRGAGVEWIEFTDPRYTTLERTSQLRIVGNEMVRNFGEGNVPQTFELSIPQINAQLAPYGTTLSEVHWEIAERAQDGSSVTLRYPTPDGAFEIRKTYRVPKVDVATRDVAPDGYLVDVTLELRNLSKTDKTLQYSLQGPVGLPLEDVANTRLFREIKLGTLQDPRNPRSITAINMTAADLVKRSLKEKAGGDRVIDWQEPVHFAGLDVQFFAALLVPSADQLEDKNGDNQPDLFVKRVRPQLLYQAPRSERSDISIVLDSPELKAAGGETITHSYRAFFGPKRPELLNSLGAEPIIQLGWFSAISKLMLLTLGFFHSTVGLPYAAAIILLTVVVRLLMFPISRMQAIEGEKMKVLAPKMKVLQEKYKNQPEEYVKALREFQKKHNYHPLYGCLPALLQLPIFLGLYNALFHAVDLRLARFLWVDNLAAPDALFQFGFTVPWLEWTEFNLLPILTIALFVIQQKMFMPPPTSEEQALQYKMMNIMMIVIGVTFYRVPAGLCLYFIASSLWGVSERLFLKKQLALQGAPAEGDVALATEGAPAITMKAEPAEPKKESWLDRMLAAADQAKNQTEGQASAKKFSKDKKTKRSKPKR